MFHALVQVCLQIVFDGEIADNGETFAKLVHFGLGEAINTQHRLFRIGSNLAQLAQVGVL